jgi:hypothetical protein
MDDDSNCGTCGHVCTGGTFCVGGLCKPEITFNTTGTGAFGSMQTFTVVTSGTYTIEAWGAQGGTPTSGTTFHGGNGAYVKGTFTLTAGDVITVLVGQQGLGVPEHGGGGGGSFVVKGSTALVVAGGGGGIRTAASGDGGPGQSTNDGQTGPYIGGTGGTGGGGGGVSTSWGSGGGGMTGNGTDDAPYGTGGKSFTSGGNGGTKGSTGCGGDAQGGFGGGGAGNGCDGGGGGGGYSGGGGGFQAGGGGSYCGGTGCVMTPGAQTGAGKVVITG